MTDMSKCSQIQVIFQEQLHGHDLPRHTQPPLVEGPPHPQEHPLGLGAVADVQQSSFRLGSFNLVSGDILCTLQQLHLDFSCAVPLFWWPPSMQNAQLNINIIARHTEQKILPGF